VRDFWQDYCEERERETSFFHFRCFIFISSFNLISFVLVNEVSSLLRDHPEINVNWTDDEQWAPLQVASYNGHVEIAKLLLAHPNINVNLKNESGQTPFSKSCENGKVSVVEVLLKDPRVDITVEILEYYCGRDSLYLPLGEKGKKKKKRKAKGEGTCSLQSHDNFVGGTPLWWASLYGHCEVVEWLIASGRNLGDVKNKKGKWDGRGYTTVEIAGVKQKSDVVSVLERFMDNPALTRQEVRKKLNFKGLLLFSFSFSFSFSLLTNRNLS